MLHGVTWCCRLPSATSVRDVRAPPASQEYVATAASATSHGAVRHSHTGSSYHAGARPPVRAPLGTTGAANQQQHASQTVMSLVLNQSSPAAAQTKMQSARWLVTAQPIITHRRANKDAKCTLIGYDNTRCRRGLQIAMSLADYEIHRVTHRKEAYFDQSDVTWRNVV